MRRLAMMSVVFSILAAGMTQGGTFRYKQSGDWFDIADVNTNGWVGTPVVPGSNDTARANWGNNTITLSGVAPVIDRFQWGVDESGGVIIEDGGVLTALTGSKIGNNNLCEGRMTINTGGVVNVGQWCMVAGNSSVTGKLTLNGGDLNITSHLWIATGTNSTGIVEINDGTLTVGGIISVGSSDMRFRGGVGSVNVNGGVLALGNIHSGTASNDVSNIYLPSVMPGSIININGSGLITLPNDFRNTINNYVNEGKLTAYDGRGTVVAELHVEGDVTNTWVRAEWGSVADIGVSPTDVVLQWDAWRFAQYSIEQSEDVTNPSSWTAVPGLEAIAGVEGMLAVTAAVTAADGAAYRVSWAPPGPEVIYATDFEDGATDWTTGWDSNSDTVWELGTPAYSNALGVTFMNAHSGTNCWGSNLAADYGSSADCWLRSPSLDLSIYPSAQLTFWDNRHMEVIFGEGSFGHVNIITNGVFATEVFSGSQSSPWSERSVVVPPGLLTDDVVVEFRFTSTATGAFEMKNGWLIDDVSIDFIP